MHVSLSSDCLLIRTLIIGLRPTLIHYDVILNYLYLQRAYFQVRAHSEVPDRHEFEGTLVYQTDPFKSFRVLSHLLSFHSFSLECKLHESRDHTSLNVVWDSQDHLTWGCLLGQLKGIGRHGATRLGVGGDAWGKRVTQKEGEGQDENIPSEEIKKGKSPPSQTPYYGISGSIASKLERTGVRRRVRDERGHALDPRPGRKEVGQNRGWS